MINHLMPMPTTWCCYHPQQLGYGNYYVLSKGIVRSIIYNSSKSSVVIICKKNRATMHVPSPSFAVNETVICEVAKVKYILAML